MNELAFRLLINNRLSGDNALLSCTALLRAIEGRREIYQAKWGGRAVIVKIFSDKIKGYRHVKREWHRLQALEKRGLNSPKPLFFGKTKDGRWAIVTEEITDCSIALDAFNAAEDRDQQLELLILVCGEVASQHKAGVLQKDMHLGNFLVKEDTAYGLDPGQMRLSCRAIGKRKSLEQLASLGCYFSKIDTEEIKKICQAYGSVRGWGFEASDVETYKKLLKIQKEKGIRRGLRKSLRTSKRNLRFKNADHLAVVDRAFFEGTDPGDLVKKIDELMQAGQILKDGNTCYISRITWGGKEAVVKRYNHKGLIHSLRQTIKRSRARRNWLAAHRLMMLDIATARPLAYIEKLKGPVVWQSYIVSEYVRGESLWSFLQDENVSEQKQAEIKKGIGTLFDKLEKYSITHGDMKHSNILVTDNGPMLIDLDSMKVHKWKWLHKIMQAKDLDRFQSQLK